MFFNRFGKHASLAQQSSLLPSKTTRNSNSSEESDGVHRRRAVALAMAVQIALPAGLLSRSSTARAADAATTALPNSLPASDDSFKKLYGCSRNALPSMSTQTASAADLYKAAVGQIRAGQYEQGVTSLQKIPVDQLNDQDSKIVDQILATTREAAREQRNARTSLISGQDAAKLQQWAEATRRFNNVISNSFADDRTYAAAIQDLAQVRLSSTAVMQPIQADIPAGTQLAQAMPASDPSSAVAAAATAPATAPTAAATSPAVDATPATPPPAAPMPATPMAVPAPAPAQASGEDAAAQNALSTAAKLKQIEQQKNTYEAQKLVDKARTEQASGQVTDALRDFDEASRLDPSNDQARTGYTEVQARLGLTAGTAVDARPEKAIQERIQEIHYRFDSAIGRANGDIDAKKFVEAQHDIDQAGVAAKTDPSLFPQSQLNDFDTIIQQAQVRLQTAKTSAENTDTAKATADATTIQQERARQYERDKERTVAGLIQDARQFTDEGKYEEALAVVENIEKIDPTNLYANGVQMFLEDKAHNKLEAQYKRQFSKEFTDQLNRAQEELIPYDDIIRYSPDWPKISEERDNEVKADRGEDEEDAALQAQLDRHLPELRFNANSLTDVIDFLRDVTGTNIYVDWPALERASIARDAPVTARLRDIKFSKALELIFKSVEGEDDDHKLGYTLDDGVITISTRKELNKNTVTRRYDINDLLFVAPDYNDAPDLSLQSASQGQSAGGTGGGGGAQSQQLFTTTGTNNSQQNPAGEREARIDEIKKYITDNVDTNTWKDNGGDVGSISSSPLRAVLLITQTAASHKKIQSVLDSLRASQALQVSIETRFLTVQRNYLEDIGVNASFEFNPLKDPSNPRSGVNNSRFTPISIIQNQVSDNSTFVDANGNTVANSAQGSRTLDWVSNIGNAAVPGSIAANTADYPNPLVVSGSYVDNFTVSFLLRAVQANANTTSLTAPRLTLFSGQRSVIIVQTQQAYVSGLTPVVATGAALFNPTVSTTTAEGVVLSVQATVSPDRKYVYMNLKPQLARLRALVPFTLSAVVTPTTTVLGTAAASQIVQGTLQLPTIDITEVETSASVPDGATLLLGGQTLAAESTREQGVPVLSKIPFLKRLFTNRASDQDEQILLILVKPTILIQHEQELKQFPQLSTKLNG